MLKETTPKNIKFDIIISSLFAVFQIGAYFSIHYFIWGFHWSDSVENILNEIYFYQKECVFFFALLLLEGTIWYYTFKLRTKIWMLSSSILVSLLLLLVVFQAREATSYGQYYQDFDAKIWKNSTEKPFKMVRTFYKEETFDNMSLQTFADSLGEGTASYEKYKINDVSFMTDENVIVKFTFCEEKVCDVELVVK